MKFKGQQVVVCLIGSLLIGCGGGGGGGGSSEAGSVSAAEATQITMSPANVESTYPEVSSAGGSDYSVEIQATVTGKAIAGTVYAYVVDSEGVLKPGPLSITQTSANVFKANLIFNRDKPEGIYTGVWTLQLCRDSACASPYSVTGNTLPYKLTITAPIKFTATVNGNAVSTTNLTINDGDIVTLDSNLPITWSPDTDGYSSLKYTNVTTTPTHWSATVNWYIGSLYQTETDSVGGWYSINGPGSALESGYVEISMARPF